MSVGGSPGEVGSLEGGSGGGGGGVSGEGDSRGLRGLETKIVRARRRGRERDFLGKCVARASSFDHPNVKNSSVHFYF